MCRDWPSFRLAPELATFVSSLYTDMWTPLCSSHTPIQEKQGFLCVGIGRASVWRPSQTHSGVSYTRICATATNLLNTIAGPNCGTARRRAPARDIPTLAPAPAGGPAVRVLARGSDQLVISW